MSRAKAVPVIDEAPEPEPPEGFMRVHHDGLAAVAVIPTDSVSIYAGRGWVAIDTASPDESAADSDNSTEAS